MAGSSRYKKFRPRIRVNLYRRPPLRALSTDACPPPEIRSPRAIASSAKGYSYPRFAAKKPPGKCTPTTAVSIVHAMKNAPTRVKKPRPMSRPPSEFGKCGGCQPEPCWSHESERRVAADIGLETRAVEAAQNFLGAVRNHHRRQSQPNRNSKPRCRGCNQSSKHLCRVS